ncbi:ATP-dependent Clp protease ATP-binding subunit [Sulfidibacter corallicola]|uniref:ATP-dependent Clp protease ATP-binding subunit n=1 Tax=Sulfidibacter corallicola TaxID=2818388 RepID=A0A8A4TX63_SULCO|nr:ATP-dependent Clp protease ATP-binding subunit [Sulfidibacter corallicola]QTD53562.1 ATP-dependent Clp protease ATP-binding subunit [Sulfidibacter corallicola]
MFEKYTDKARRVLFFARYEASQFGASTITSAHLLLGLVREAEKTTMAMLEQMGISIQELKDRIISQSQTMYKKPVAATTVEIPLSEETKRVLHYALKESMSLNHKYVGVEHILLGILRDEHAFASQLLAEMGADLYRAKEILLDILKEEKLNKKRKEHPLLGEFSRNLTDLAERGAFDRLIGRELEIERIIQILARRRKNNPILLGEPGVGKTSIVEGLAQRIVQGNVPIELMDKRIYALDLSLVVAGTKYRGQFEERLKSIIAEASKDISVILFIDEIHSIIGTGAAEGSLDAANILKPALSRGEIQCIGSTTHREFSKYIEKDRALVRRFQPVNIMPPDEPETEKILFGLKDHYEGFHRVRYSEDALRGAVYLSSRYITDRALPDKALDLLDEAGARVKLAHSTNTQTIRNLEKDLRQVSEDMNEAVANKDFERAVVLREYEIKIRKQIQEEKDSVNRDSRVLDVKLGDVEQVVSSWTGIPVTAMKEEDKAKLALMEETLRTFVIGQDEAISAVSRAIRRSRTGLKNPNRPMGSFLFLGPTGVGKTELSKQLARFLFGDAKKLIRFDMSEYMEKHSVSKMIGSPPGYVGFEEGGQLTDKVKRNPYSIVLFDEIEKAHPDLVNILLQIFEDGQVTDAFGNTIDFRNTIIIMTSNVGSKQIVNEKTMGLTSNVSQRDRNMKQEAMRELKRVFRPEFINRIDEVVVFDKLKDDHLLQICSLLVNEINENLAKSNLHVEIAPEGLRWLLDLTSSDRQYGARPLRRIIQRHVEDPLAEAIVSADAHIEGPVIFQFDPEQERLDIVLPPSPKGLETTEEAECPS